MKYIGWAFGFSALLLIVIIGASKRSGVFRENSQEEKIVSINLRENEVERLIREGDYTGLTESKLDSIAKTEYSFYKSHLQSSTSSKSMLITVLKSVNKPWCFKYFHELLRDSNRSIKAEAAQGIFLLGSDVDAEKILVEIKRLNGGDPKERTYGLPQLILSVGNSRNEKLLDMLLDQSMHEVDLEVNTAYQKASAKLGFKKSIREIKMELMTGDGYSKTAALLKVNYIDKPEWVEKVVPMLLDEEVGFSMPWGPKTLTRRVCDLAVDVLREIDPIKKIDFPKRSPGRPYSDGEMSSARIAYGVASK